jgi:hypothetical protein
MKGDVVQSSIGSGATQRLVFDFAPTQTSSAAKLGTPRTLYPVATQEQYINDADDRLRGKGNNPFGNFKDTLPNIISGHPPFVGDESIFKFDVFTDSSLKTSAGSATLTCRYYFKQSQFCDVLYQLNGGTIYGDGAFGYSADSFAIAVTGASGKYSGLTGIIQVTPGPSHSQRLAFQDG